MRRVLADRYARLRDLEASDSRLVDQFIEKLRERGFGDRCNMCGNDDWIVGASILGLPLLRGGQHTGARVRYRFEIGCA